MSEEPVIDSEAVAPRDQAPPQRDRRQDSGDIVAGVLDLTSGGAGFLRTRERSFLPGDGDIYVPAKLVQRFRLRELAGLSRDTAVVGAVGASFSLEKGIDPLNLAR